MNSLCNNCSLCCRLIPTVNNGECIVRDGIQQIDSDFFKFLSPLSIENARSIDKNYVNYVLNIFPDANFYSCKNLSEENSCALNELPRFCIDFPATPLALIPEECSCSGHVFLLNEELKSKIRKIKEEILEYEALIKSDEKNSKSYQKIIDNLRRFVNKYAQYGSNDW